MYSRVVSFILKFPVKSIIVFFLCFFFSYILVTPNIYFKTGNIFFGDVRILYNVTLAEFFFARATQPIFGTVPPYSNYQLSRTHFIQGSFEPSLEAAKRELELYPDHIRTYYILGLTLGYMNREEEAIDAFGEFIKHYPQSWAARNDRAWLQFRIGDFKGGLETLEPVVHLTENAWVQNTYGTLLMNQIRYKEAQVALEHAKRVADSMTEEDWGRAYPGNDPRVYGRGLESMRASIEKNLAILALIS